MVYDCFDGFCSNSLPVIKVMKTITDIGNFAFRIPEFVRTVLLK